MTPSELFDADKAKKRKAPSAAWLFFQRWLANPLAMGSVTPSSPALRRIIAANLTCGPDEIVVEFGGGTGAITKALLEAGIPPNRIYVIEIDGELATYLRRSFPGVQVIHGDCRQVEDLIGADRVGKVGTVVCGIPTVTLPMETQREIIEASFKVMPKGRRFLLYTYSLTSPLPVNVLGLNAKRVGWTAANIPPASVFAYSKAE